MSIRRSNDPSVKSLTIFGDELRERRMRAQVTQQQLADMTQFSRSLLAFIERGERTPSRNLAQRCDDALRADGELLHLWTQLTRDASPRWFRTWLEVEEEAHTLHTWQPLVIPGLLQTEDYARAVIRGEAGITTTQVEKAVNARLERQQIFAREAPPMLWAVIDEGVLHRPIGGRTIMRNQVRRLLDAIESPHIGIQVVPTTLGITTGLLGGFVIAQMPDTPDTVYIESATHGHVSTRPEDVKVIQSSYDTVRAEAQPQPHSIELIREAEKRWT
ncbi:helix-turn-helix transcriptional regulator [Sphaerisporangium rubeum]|uniref:Transcriptional regulator with XRE-family HTH domain n=1 Tax=Sphaerisporangium rubeum TaxID=321317 RepID=A0A7X0IKL5_9ACTN|nr:helix-turn-helix transcriptional regulator [Sphaerisporangium rubeum]MBB6475407.1 transcriptional regulator with XRE-family HTH domain [Sphaerisporangium rubeum]